MVRKENAQGDICPLQGIIRNSETVKEPGLPIGLRINRALHRRFSPRSQKRVKKAWNYAFGVFDRLRGKARPPEDLSAGHPAEHLAAGDLVRVRPREEIQATLDRWHSLRGCAFLGEMAGYCGTTQRVLKRVERFMDEKDYRLKSASGIVLLEGAICSGTAGTGRCDRACFFFWREEWLEKLSGPAGPKA